MDSTEQCSVDACSPIVSLQELLSSRHDKLRWCDMVQSLVKRASPRQPTANFYSMDSGPAMLDDAYQNRPQVLVCHDYKGNYLEDKWINGGLSWEEYRFYNWSVVDIFCYFSHYFITMPTLQYLNAAHLNGVKVIGTIIVEGLDGVRTINEVLKSREQVEIVADSLVEICKRLKFEGWLLNIEVAIDSDKVPILKHFIKYLTEKTHAEIPHGTIIWYDSVISPGGALAWQNELNANNKSFFELCDGIFTNYNWSIHQLERTSKLVDAEYPNRRQDVFFGIDVFGRGQIAGFQSNETLSKSAAFQFSSAIFAPGWTSETINTKIGFDGLTHNSLKYKTKFNEVFLLRNDRFWMSLYKYFFIFGPKVLPFCTSFCIGSGKKMYRMGKVVKENWFNLKLQSFQPSMPASEGYFTHYYEDAFNGGSCLLIHSTELIRIFTAELSCHDGLIFSYTIKREHERNDLEVHLNILNTVTNIERKIVCKSEKEGFDAVASLNHDDVRIINKFLAHEGHTPLNVSINNWETRVFHLKFNHLSKHSLITDIGVKKHHSGKVLLGQLTFHSAKHLDHDFHYVDVINV